MTKDELIVKLSLELMELKEYHKWHVEKDKKIMGLLYGIGQPLNDNMLKFNDEQLDWCYQISNVVESPPDFIKVEEDQ